MKKLVITIIVILLTFHILYGQDDTSYSLNILPNHTGTFILNLGLSENLKELQQVNPSRFGYDFEIIKELQNRLPSGISLKLQNEISDIDTIIGVVTFYISFKEVKESKTIGGSSMAPGFHTVTTIKKEFLQYNISLKTELNLKAYSNWNMNFPITSANPLSLLSPEIWQYIPNFQFLDTKNFTKQFGGFGIFLNNVDGRFVYIQNKPNEKQKFITNKSISFRLELVSISDIFELGWGFDFGLNTTFSGGKKFNWVQFDTIDISQDYYDIESTNKSTKASLADVSLDIGPCYMISIRNTCICPHINLGLGADFLTLSNEDDSNMKTFFTTSVSPGIRVFLPPFFYGIRFSFGVRIIYPLLKRSGSINFNDRKFYYDFRDVYRIQFDFGLSGDSKILPK